MQRKGKLAINGKASCSQMRPVLTENNNIPSPFILYLNTQLCYMQWYKNLSGDSGVEGFETRKDSIKIRFRGGAVYLYTYKSAGKNKIEKMKRLALAGKGLSTYISTHVKNDYATKLE
jgi:hypothetical protein